MSYNRGFYMIMRSDGLTPIYFDLGKHTFTPTFRSYAEGNKFAADRLEIDYLVVEVAIGRA